ncbi:unnamed protein product [Mytilus coruscus]|uniref:Uncharacterized protein n=1 Tax=Mytilus coruscus TaxID=42192 RepID=A0A6J8DDF7_MYTCO|nr:unnamed protein product [Mytilus coruscus]
MPTKEETIVITDSPEKDKYKCISSSSDDEPVTKKPRYQPYSGYNLDDETVTDVVDKVPWNINGNCFFKMEYNKADGQRMKCSKDGRPWERYNNSYTKNFQKKRGTRLRARYKGSYQCNNTCCPFMKQYNMPNSMHIIKHDDISHCEECNSRMTFISCPAVKVWEFPKTSHLMTVFHTGIHTCYPIKNPDIPKSDLVDAMHLAPSSKPSEISNRLMMRKIQHSSSRKEVEDLAESLTATRKARNLKQKILNSELLSIKLANLQEKCLN